MFVNGFNCVSMHGYRSCYDGGKMEVFHKIAIYNTDDTDDFTGFSVAYSSKVNTD